ncbi:MAG: excinuclease ABC subunit UvrC [Actinomycetota bacterium]|nr:excinuclease ABC subunit UvrC [Actinomycetota bacterium]
MSIPTNLEDELKNLPDGPGAYIFKDEKGRPIYIGKALSLKKRIRSYFQKTTGQSAKTAKLVSKIASLDFLMTDSEMEALILEANLIKRHKPKFNVSLRDDKTYPFIAISLSEDYPKVTVIRGEKRAGHKYFGPFTKAHAMRETLDVLRKIFPLRTCSKAKFNKAKKDSSPCLYHYLKMCSSPCIGAISKEGYDLLVLELVSFLEGRYAKVASSLKKEMDEAAARQEYERAALCRDKIRAIEHVLEGQKMISPKSEDNDYIAIAKERRLAVASVLYVRGGKLIGSDSHVLNLGGIDEEQVASSFIKQFYGQIDSLPRKIFIGGQVDEKDLIEAWLKKRAKRKVQIIQPQRGKNRRLVELAKKNAAHSLSFQTIKAREEGESNPLEGLKDLLKLEWIPQRIEAYDISTLMGRDSVASMIVFEDGLPLKEDYRRFKMAYQGGMNDVAMIEEVLRRRFKRHAKTKTDPFSSFAKLPDLVLIDGGLPQLTVADRVLKDLEMTGVELIALAKREEEIYRRGSARPISLAKDDPALNLLMRVRDEAHRFALSYQANLRSASMLSSALDELPKIGPARKRLLLSFFKTPENILKAELPDLEKVLSRSLAKDLFEHLRKVKLDG